MKSDLQIIMDTYDSCIKSPEQHLGYEFRVYIDNKFSDDRNIFRIAMLTGYFLRVAETMLKQKQPKKPEKKVKAILNSAKEKSEKIKSITDYLEKNDAWGLPEKLENYALIPFEHTIQVFKGYAEDHLREAYKEGRYNKETAMEFGEYLYRFMAYGYIYKLSEDLVQDCEMTEAHPLPTAPIGGNIEGENAEKLYEMAWKELEEGTFDKGLWARLLAENAGDEATTKAEYLKERVQRLGSKKKKKKGVAKKKINRPTRTIPKKYDGRTQECLRCNKVLPLTTDNFSKYKNPQTGMSFRSVCKPCMSLRKKNPNGRPLEKKTQPGTYKEPKQTETSIAHGPDVGPWDRFFIAKIEAGLSSSESLRWDEKLYLYGLEPYALSQSKANKLNNKCIKALTRAYKKDTAGKNKKEALHWNDFNEALYKHSRCMISGIVQNWYLSEGRPLEKKVVGLFSKPDW